MRFEPGRSYEENRGLELPILFLEPIRLLHPQLSYSDLWCDKPRALSFAVVLLYLSVPSLSW